MFGLRAPLTTCSMQCSPCFKANEVKTKPGKAISDMNCDHHHHE